MAKGYWVVFADVSDPEGYKEYIAANGKALAKYGARFLARGGKTEPQEGKPRSRVIVLEFPSYAAAIDCYRSPEYSAAMKLTQGRSVWDMAITEGLMKDLSHNQADALSMLCMWVSAAGPFRTCHVVLTMSVHWGKADIASARFEARG